MLNILQGLSIDTSRLPTIRIFSIFLSIFFWFITIIVNSNFKTNKIIVDER